MKHVREIETPFVYTIGDYRVATGGIDRTACFKTKTGELISGAIAGKHNRVKNIDISQECRVAEAKKRKKIENSRTENTLCGSEGLSAERRLTKRANDSIKMGEEVMKYIKNLKAAQETLTHSNVPVDVEYWQINDSVFKDKLRMFLRLWYFPVGGGKLSKTKSKQLEALKQFNLSQEGVNCCIKKCLEKLQEWKKELQQIAEDEFDGEEEIDNE